MLKTVEAFEKLGVKCFYNSITPEAKSERWKRREGKIKQRKSKISSKVIGKIVDIPHSQPSLFDID